MILEKSASINIKAFRKLAEPIKDRESARIVMSLLESFLELTPLYRGAMKEVSTKLEILDEEFSTLFDHNPIHHIQCRMKTAESIAEKMIRKGYPLTLSGLRENVRDIAGLRVVCSYVSDVYKLSEMLLAQKDITLLRKADYIENPKPSGYRSLHLVVSVPVFLSERAENVPVEVQLRTIAMDEWATLEHELRYKAEGTLPEEMQKRLIDCAELAARLDSDMQSILLALSGSEKRPNAPLY